MIRTRGRQTWARTARTAAVAMLAGGWAGAQTMATELVVSGLDRPAYATAPAGDLDRLFVVELKSGLIRIVRDGAILPAPFLDLSSKVTTTWKLGLFSLAFHPDYASNGFLYVYYVDLNEDSVLERYTVSAGDPDVADPASAAPVMVVLQPDKMHDGGMAAFGPDGYLYWALGDGGPQFDPNCMGQAPSSPLGKMLRIDVDGGAPYAVPPSNPFVGVPGTLDEIWALGLRNPWRFSWDAVTGDLYIADVGQITMEEIDVEPAGFPGGANYGWSVEEGTVCHATTSCSSSLPPCGDAAYTAPVHAYDHFWLRCAVIGGHVYRGCDVPELAGRYLYADWCTGELLSFRYANGVAVDFRDHTAELGGGTTITRPISFAEDGRGETYVIDHYDGELFKIVPNGGIACSAKLNSQGCTPAIITSGTPSYSGGSFQVNATNVLNNKSGLLFWGHTASAAPFGGGVKCVANPVKRTPIQASGGNPPPNDCSGAYTFTFSTGYMASKGIGVGDTIYAQFWSRDPFASYTTGLTDAVEFSVCP